MKSLFYTIACICVLLYSCKEELPKDKLYITETQQQISAYLESREDMTIFTQLLHNSGYFNLLNSYGRYTVFAPNDAAWRKYLSSIGKSDISELSAAQSAELFNFHVLLSNVNLKAQRTGLLMQSDTTMSGILHYVDVTGGFSNMVMNKTSQVITTVELPNGFVYSMSEVFVPRASYIYDYLVQSGYSIFAQAVEAVGLKDTLQNRRLNYPESIYSYHPKYTVFAEPDRVFQSAGINNLEQLKEAVWNRQKDDDPDELSALREFVRYHILFLWNPGYVWNAKKLTPSLYKQENLRTYAHNKSRVINIAASDIARPVPVINQTVRLNLLKSDVGFINGVVHELENVMFINKEPQLCRYTFECAEVFSIEVTGISSGSGMVSMLSKTIPYDVNWDMKRGRFNYTSGTNYSSSFYDVFGTGYAASANPSERGYWIEFYLRNVPAGIYDVYLNYRRINNTCSENVNVYFRKFGEDYDFSTQKLNSAKLDFSQDKRTVNGQEVSVPEYNQNLFIGKIFKKTDDNEEALDSGDYVMRFVHGDMKEAYYDNIILVPVE